MFQWPISVAYGHLLILLQERLGPRKNMARKHLLNIKNQVSVQTIPFNILNQTGVCVAEVWKRKHWLCCLLCSRWMLVSPEWTDGIFMKAWTRETSNSNEGFTSQMSDFHFVNAKGLLDYTGRRLTFRGCWVAEGRRTGECKINQAGQNMLLYKLHLFRQFKTSLRLQS